MSSLFAPDVAYLLSIYLKMLAEVAKIDDLSVCCYEKSAN